MSDILCRCGHSKKVHPDTIFSKYKEERKYLVCDGCFRNNRVKGIKQFGTIDCEEYVPDNLKHIEILAVQRGLI